VQALCVAQGVRLDFGLATCVRLYSAAERPGSVITSRRPRPLGVSRHVVGWESGLSLFWGQNGLAAVTRCYLLGSSHKTKLFMPLLLPIANI
jgi:hypothetical protein